MKRKDDLKGFAQNRLYERDDFIQVDHRFDGFSAVCIKGLREENGETMADFGILRRFGDDLSECVKFTLGATSAMRLIRKELYKPTDITDLFFTEAAIRRIKRGKYVTAEGQYPELKLMKEAWE